MPFKTSLVKNIIFSIVSVALFFGAIDVSIRIYMSLKYRNTGYLIPFLNKNLNRKKPDDVIPCKMKLYHGGSYYKFLPGKFYNYKKGEFSVTINSHGFRSPEFNIKKPAGKKRICVMGGSVVFGLFLKDDETFPYYLSELLGKEFEVINCGFPRYRLNEIRNLFRYELLGYSPDMLIIYSGFNDAFPVLFEHEESLGYRLHKLFYYRWMLYTILREKYSSIRYKTAAPIPDPRPPEKISKRFYSELKGITDIAKARGIKLIFIPEIANTQEKKLELNDVVKGSEYDSFYALEKKYYDLTSDASINPKNSYAIQHFYNNRLMEQLAAEMDIPITDPKPFLNKSSDIFIDHAHFTPEGTRILAGIAAGEVLKVYPDKK